MKWAAMILAFASFAAWLPAQAQNADTAGGAQSGTTAPRRPPVRIRVQPIVRPYPGPDAVRQCESWLEQEHRPSGTVIVPQMHCWWERG